MRKTKRISALFLIAVLLLGAVTPAFAATAKNVKHYDSVFVIGDSVACGYTTPTAKNFGRAENSYPDIIADAVEADALYSVAFGGCTIPLAMDLLNIEVEKDTLEYEYDYLGYMAGSGVVDTVKKIKSNSYAPIGNLDKRIADCDLFIIEVGGNDVTNAPYYSAQKLYKQCIARGESSTAALSKALDRALQMVEMGLDSFSYGYTKMIEKILALNSDAEIVLVGYYNPFVNVTVSGQGEMLNIGETMSEYVEEANEQLRLWAEEYGCYYADVFGLSSSFAKTNLSGLKDIGKIELHPDQAGHKFMAEKILAVLPELSNVTSVSASNVAATGKIKLSWTAVKGAEKYVVYTSATKGGSYKKLAETTGRSFLHSAAKVGTSYYYKVAAVVGGTECDLSKAVLRCCDLPAPVVKGSNVASTGQVKLTWAKIDGAVKYEIYRATSKNGTYTKMYTTTNTSYTNTTSKAGNTYYYKVKAIAAKSAANSAFSDIVTRTCDVARPTVKIALSSGHPKLTWSAVSGASKYEIYRATSKNGTYTKYYTTSNLYFNNTSAKSGSTYYYKVLAVSSSKTAANSAYSTVVSIKAK